MFHLLVTNWKRYLVLWGTNKKHLPLLVIMLWLHIVGTEGLLLSLWLLIHADISRPALWPKPATWEAPSHVLYPIQLTSNRKWGIGGALVRRGIGRERLHTRSRCEKKQNSKETHFLCLSHSFSFILSHKSICLSPTQSFEFTTRNLLRSPETIPVQRTLKKFRGAFVCDRGGPSRSSH